MADIQCEFVQKLAGAWGERIRMVLTAESRQGGPLQGRDDRARVGRCTGMYGRLRESVRELPEVSVESRYIAVADGGQRRGDK